MLRWDPSGLVYEPDQRHAEVIIRELGLENAGSVLTPGTRAEQNVASAPSEVLGIPVEEDSEPMDPQDATRFRGLAARCNYLGQDRVDLQYACKEVSRRMAKPRCHDWQLLKRIGRYLVWGPKVRADLQVGGQTVPSRRLYGLRLGGMQDHMQKHQRRCYAVG